MATSLPPSFRELLDRGSADDLSILAELAAVDGDAKLEVGGKLVTLSADVRAALSRLVEHLQVGDDLRRHLDADSLAIRLEPIVDLRSGEIEGYEALTEMPKLDGVPLSWFKEAAELGLGADIELAAVGLALAKLPDLPGGAYISINVSPRTAMTGELGMLMRKVDPARVVLELTEHAAVQDYASLNAALSVLRARGIRLAVDDAGAGFSSLHHILLMRPEIVKLDVSLIRDLDTDLARRALVSGLIFFAQHISATTVAEGIETAEQEIAARELGVRFGQGWHYL